MEKNIEVKLEEYAPDGQALWDFITGKAPEAARALDVYPATVDDALVVGMRLGITALALMIRSAVQEGQRDAATGFLVGASQAASTWDMAGLIVTAEQLKRRSH